ncbi:MAG TPA: FkbM family methyltransferase [Sphingomicrobium sp.]|nr:FkbM family methyltransferase [Sphingomicrobium sp.]
MRLLVYDIGLHKGEDAEFYLKKGFGVVGVDADPDHCEIARQRLSQFLATGQLKIVNVAVSNHRGPVTFYRSEKSDWGTIVGEWDEHNRAHGYSSTRVSIDSVTLADLIQEHGRPYFMKIDLEGMDRLVLASLKGSPDLPKYISIEMAYPHDPTFRNAKSEFAALARLGYNRFKIVPQHQVERQVPPYPPREGAYADFRFECGSSGLFGEESPGEWLTMTTALRKFRHIMLRHFPEGHLYRIEPLHRLYLNLRERLTGRGEAGYWYDIHAKRSSSV